MTYQVQINYADAEIPTSVGDAQLALQHAPAPVESLQLFRNGLLQTTGVDYTCSGYFVVPAVALAPEDKFVCWYRY